MRQLEVTDLSVEYDRGDGNPFLAIDKLSLGVDTGQFVSIVGPSGCGKTTLLKSIIGLIPQRAGTIAIAGSAAGQDDNDRAMVFQEASLFPWFSVVRNVAYGLECRGVGKRQARQTASQYLSLVGLAGFENHYPHELSGGMQQRANLARALAVDPQILLMDEPFAALDAQTRELMQAELLDIWQQTEKTVLFITHQIDEAVYLSDRVIVLSGRPGHVVADIPVNLARPRDLHVKRTTQFIEYIDQIWKLIEKEAGPGTGSAADAWPAGTGVTQ